MFINLENSMDISSFEEKKISSDKKFEGNIISLSVDTVCLPNGKEATREVVHHPGAVCVVPLTERNEVVLVRQYRYPFSRVTLEIPAGKLDSPTEDHKVAALRELSEETGAECRKIEFIGELHTSPAILNEVIYMYVARGLDFGEQHPDDDEFLSVTCLPIEKAVEMIVSGEIRDAKTQAAILKVYVMQKGIKE